MRVCSPGKHRVVWLLRLLLVLLADVQRGQVHAQQLGDALSAVDVSVLIQDLQGGGGGGTPTGQDAARFNTTQHHEPRRGKAR